MAEKRVYFFGNGKAEGNAKMKELLGGKGANLAEMTSLGVPVPPGFTIATKVCGEYYKSKGKWPKGLAEEVKTNVTKLEKAMNAKMSDPARPLLVSVRSGAAVSMPGMMDTVLNLGLNDDVIEGIIAKTGNARFAYDIYRRFIDMFGDVVMGCHHEKFEEKIDAAKKKAKVELDSDLNAEQLKGVVDEYKKVYKKEVGQMFPQDGMEQLTHAINAVFGSWNSPRAIRYRELNDIKGLLGTAVNVQAMVFGNMGDDCGTGVCFTRNPSTGKKEFYGEFLMNAQGEDVVAGIRTPIELSKLNKVMPKAYKELTKLMTRLEKHYKDMQDMEFTIQEKKLYILQTRKGKRTAMAAVKIGRRYGQRASDPEERSRDACHSGPVGSVAAPAVRSQGQARRHRQGPARLARRGGRPDRLHRRCRRSLARQGQEGHPGPERDQPRRHRWHGRGRRYPDGVWWHDQSCGRGCSRHGQVLRRRRARSEHRLQDQEAQRGQSLPQGRRLAQH